MNFNGRELDPVSLWGQFVDLPKNLGSPLPTYLPKVRCPNPAHQTTKRHFQVNTRKPIVHCFAKCGISGSYERAVAMILGLKTANGEWDERAARRLVLRHTRTALVRTPSAYEGLGTRKTVSEEDAVSLDEKRLNNGEFQFLPKAVRDYLDRRGIDSSSRGKWQLGWDEDTERLVIPAYDERHIFRFLIRREITGSSSWKYLYTEGAIKTSLLFGSCYIDQDVLGSIGLVLCEGSLDAIRLHQIGVRNAVAILGTGLSTRQTRIIDKLNPRRVYLMFDRDGAGVDNIYSARERLTKFPLQVCLYPGSKSDPAEMTKEEVDRSIERALPIARFLRKARTLT